ncbi:MAG: hypothetical protein WBM99_07315 [Psychromonas sp.]
MDKTFEMNMIVLIALGILIFLLSIWFGKVWNNSKLRSQRARLDAHIEALKLKHSQKLQSVENELQVERQSNQVAFIHLIEKRVAILDQGYKYLVDFDAAIHAAIRPVPGTRETISQQETYDSAVLRFTSFVTFFEKNKMYFSTGVAKKVSKSHSSIAATLDLMRALLYAKQSLSNGISDELQNLFKKADNEIRHARQDIEAELRAILHIDDSQNTETEDDLSTLSMFR